MANGEHKESHYIRDAVDYIVIGLPLLVWEICRNIPPWGWLLLFIIWIALESWLSPGYHGGGVVDQYGPYDGPSGAW